MSAATYLAWNGRSYPWPPPEGWYEASDGRWWAPGSGPAPAPNSAGAASTTDLDPAEPDPLQGVDDPKPWADQAPPGDSHTLSPDHAGPADTGNPVRDTHPDHTGNTHSDHTGNTHSHDSANALWLPDHSRSPAAPEPAWTTPDDQGSIPAGPTTQMPGSGGAMDPFGGPAGPSAIADSAADRYGPQGGRSTIPIDPLPGHGSGPAVWQSAPPSVENENRTPLFIAAGVLGVLVIAALAVIGLARGGEEDTGSALPTSDDSQSSTTTGPADESTTTPDDQQPTSASTEDGGADTSSSESSGSGSTTAESTATTIAVTSTTSARVTTTIAAPNTSTSLASIDTLTDAEKVSEFRASLQTNGLSSDQLTDDDLVEFGTSFCIFAIAADDYEQYAGFREEAIGQSESQLTGGELTLAVDAAVQVFCPDEALRLGIG